LACAKADHVFAGITSTEGRARLLRIQTGAESASERTSAIRTIQPGVATDHVRSSRKPQSWNIGGFVELGARDSSAARMMKHTGYADVINASGLATCPADWTENLWHRHHRS
jgi:hypothetical protein